MEGAVTALLLFGALKNAGTGHSSVGQTVLQLGTTNSFFSRCGLLLQKYFPLHTAVIRITHVNASCPWRNIGYG